MSGEWEEGFRRPEHRAYHAIAKRYGGKFYGPNVEHVSFPEHMFYALMRAQRGPMPEQHGGELELAVRIANKALDRVNADPDDELAVLSRQLLRSIEPQEVLGWLPIESAPKDGTMLFLLVKVDESRVINQPTEDDTFYRTIGHNNRDDDGEDEWRFAGWCWDHDHFTEGRGTPVKWMPMPAKPLPEDA